MKEYLPTLTIVFFALAWSEFRYQQLASRLENLEPQNIIQNKIDSPQKSEKERLEKGQSSFPQKSISQKTKTQPKGKERATKENTKDSIQTMKRNSKSFDLSNPEIQEELYQFLEERDREQKEIKRAEGVGKYLDYVDKRIETYSQENQLPTSVSQAVMLEIQARTNEYVAVEQAAEDGEIDWSEAKPEMERIKEDGKINLTELLGGEEEYQNFERFVWGRK